jgi:hypothetical protein
MVIMCLFTTFITSPLIEYIYPVHLRVNDVSQETEKKDTTDYDLVGDHDLSITILTDVIKVSREARLAIIVDRLEHLQGVMDLLTCFQPNNPDSSLTATVLKFEEPSFTTLDEFIGLNENRLISVTQESSDILALIHPDVSKPAPKLLPLSMFIKAMGAAVSVYDIRGEVTLPRQITVFDIYTYIYICISLLWFSNCLNLCAGDPQEFPSEVRSMVSTSKSDIVFFPWRHSQYVERFIWSTLRKALCPIALFVQTEVSVPLVPEGRQRSNSMLGHLNPVVSESDGHRSGESHKGKVVLNVSKYLDCLFYVIK